jgi:5-methyltetrahydrofolate--homocysteine methyltransferase
LNKQEILEKISEAVIDFDALQAQELCETALAMGVPPYEIIIDGMAKGMDLISKKYENGDYFLSELVMAGETMKQALEVVEPHLKQNGVKSRGTVVIGTVQGDLHDIGKHIFGNLLRGAGFTVIDLGFDVSPKLFADEVERSKPDILGMSTLITTTMTSMAETITELKKRGTRNKVKIIIGGAAVDNQYASKIGADAAARDAIEGVSTCKDWTG